MIECRVDNLGTKRWYLNDRLHREDGPAIERDNGDKSWWLNGKRHRENGPAIEWAGGYKEWFILGKRIDCASNEEFLKLIKLKTFW